MDGAEGVQTGDVLALVQHPAPRGLHGAADQIEQCGFARTVRTDDRVKRAGLDPQIDIVDRDKRTELLAKSSRLENEHRHASTGLGGADRMVRPTAFRISFRSGFPPAGCRIGKRTRPRADTAAQAAPSPRSRST